MVDDSEADRNALKTNFYNLASLRSTFNAFSDMMIFLTQIEQWHCREEKDFYVLLLIIMSSCQIFLNCVTIESNSRYLFQMPKKSRQNGFVDISKTNSNNDTLLQIQTYFGEK